MIPASQWNINDLRRLVMSIQSRLHKTEQDLEENQGDAFLTEASEVLREELRDIEREIAKKENAYEND